jgi:mannose-6-phosphate isomerase-like protein (cupin superfamily)
MTVSPPKVRRIITGHDSNGKAIIESDDKLTPYNPFTGAPVSTDPENGQAPFGFTVVHRTAQFPASNTERPVEYNGKKMSLEHHTGTTCRVVDFPPCNAGGDGQLPKGFMHRTQSLDFGVVLKGRIVLELDDGVETEVEEGAVVVQRYGTHHLPEDITGAI